MNQRKSQTITKMDESHEIGSVGGGEEVRSPPAARDGSTGDPSLIQARRSHSVQESIPDENLPNLVVKPEFQALRAGGISCRTQFKRFSPLEETSNLIVEKEGHVANFNKIEIKVGGERSNLASKTPKKGQNGQNLVENHSESSSLQDSQKSVEQIEEASEIKQGLAKKLSKTFSPNKILRRKISKKQPKGSQKGRVPVPDHPVKEGAYLNSKISSSSPSSRSSSSDHQEGLGFEIAGGAMNPTPPQHSKRSYSIELHHNRAEKSPETDFFKEQQKDEKIEKEKQLTAARTGLELINSSLFPDNPYTSKLPKRVLKISRKKKTQKGSRKKLYITLTVIATIILILALTWNAFTSQIFEFLIKAIKAVHELPAPFNYLIFFTAYFTCHATGFPLPSLMTVVLGYVLKTPILPAIYYTSAITTVAMFHFWLAKKYLLTKLQKKYGQKPLFKVITKEASKRPCLTSFCTQCVAGPALVKNFLLILAGVDFYSIVCNAFLYNMVYSIVLGMVGSNAHDLGDLMGSKKFSEMNTVDKVSTVMSYLAIGFTIGMVVGLSWFVRGRVKKMEEEVRKEERDAAVRRAAGMEEVSINAACRNLGLHTSTRPERELD